MWMLKIYYEQKSFESAISLIDSFSHFLSKNKIVPVLEKERFGKFLKYLNVLIKIQTGSAYAKDLNLKKEILNSGNIISKRWLIEKVDQLV